MRVCGERRAGRGCAVSVALDLAGRRVLVLGASSGVGRAVAELAARAGARVVLAARRRERLDAAAVALRGEGCSALALACDVTNEAECRSAVAQAVAALAGLDALVYASGVSPLCLLGEAGQADWRAVLDVNLIGASLVTAAALDALRASRGRAVYVGSYSERQTLPGIGLYSVSKSALSALIEAWRMEHPEVDFTKVVLGNTTGTEFAHAWGQERTLAITKLWVERGLFPAPKMMPLANAAEAICSVLAVRGHVDEIGVMPRLRDTQVET
jgi:NAD(P)-dependent dehydrogenase (short-subunit alcohol dehydrogenase family)